MRNRSTGGAFATIAMLALSMALLCSCTTTYTSPYAKEAVVPVAPGELPFNKGATELDPIYVVLRNETGERLLFAVDTGAPITILDKSLEPSLGKRVSTRRIDFYYYGRTAIAHGYRPPKFYFGDAPLVFSNAVSGDRIWTTDLSGLGAERPVMGILGMDVLHRYCVQIDFAARHIRLLEPSIPATESWGAALPLLGAGVPDFRGAPLGGSNDFCGIDTGGTGVEVSLTKKVFREATTSHQMTVTNLPAANVNRQLRGTVLNELTFVGQSYHHVKFRYDDAIPMSTLGLDFLARNLVTINFPKGILYLKCTNAEPLPGPTNSFDTLDSTLGWWTAAAGSSNGVTPETIADALLAPPDLRPGNKLDVFFDAMPLKRLYLQVGPPDATLGAIDIPSANYHLKTVSNPTAVTFTTTADKPVPVAEKGTVVVLHGYNLQKEYLIPCGLSLAQAGYHVILMDLRGHGEATGQEISYGKYETADLTQALDYLDHKHIIKGKVSVIGCGLGGDIAMQWAARDARLATVIAVSPYTSLEVAFEKMATNSPVPIPPEMLKQGLELAAQRLGINWRDWSSGAAVVRLKQPILLIGGEKDDLATPEELQKLKAAAPAGSECVELHESRRRSGHVELMAAFAQVTAWLQAHGGN